MSESSERKIKNFGPSVNPEEIQLDQLIGEGCFGKVYKGRCRSVDVAVKVPKKQNISPKKLAEFLQEVELMSKNYCPHINLFMGACTVPGKVMIVTELLETDLEALLADKTKFLSLYDRMKMAKDAAQGMAWLHGATPALIHRDLKTSNLLVDKSGRIKVCDFGLAQFAERGQKYMDEDGAKGTPLYMAPEILAGEEFNESSDVYSFAIVLWEIVTREEAFAHHTDYDAFVEAVCVGGERPPIPDTCLPSIRALLEDCWEDQPTRRPTFPSIVERLNGIIVDAAIPDKLSSTMWKQNFLLHEEVPWEDFIVVLARVLKLSETKPDRLGQLLEVRCLQSVLVPEGSKNQNVRIERFGKIMGCFGPLSATFHASLVKILESKWFFGDTGAHQAQSKLSDKPPGSFLIRFSTNASTPHWFTITMVTEDRQIRHLRIVHEPAGPFTLNGKEYMSLHMLVSSQIRNGLCSKPCPDSPYQHLFQSSNLVVGDGYGLYA